MKRPILLDYNYDGRILDFTPTVQSIMDGVVKGESRAHLAVSFHKTVAIALCETQPDLMERYNISDAAISGGVFQKSQISRVNISRLACRQFIYE